MNWKNLLLSSILIVLLLFLNQVVVVSASYTNVSVSPAKEMIESNPNLVILDVRTLEEYESGHIENAVLIPVTELEARIDELDKEKETLVYCRSGVRSATASQILVDNGFVSVYNMLGGILAWIDVGYWIEIIHRGDLIIDGTQTYVIENCTYVQIGNIFVRDWAKLLVRNAEIQMNQTYFMQYEFKVEDYGTLELEDAVLRSDQTLSLDSFQYSKVSLRNVTLVGTVWFSFGGYSEVSVYQLTYFGNHWIQLSGHCDVSMEDSRIHGIGIDINEEPPDLKLSGSFIGAQLWLGFSRGSIVDVNDLKPGFHEYLDLKEKVSVYGVSFDVTLNKTFVNSWWVNVYCDSEMVISNSVLGVGMQISGLTVRFEDLKPKFHEYSQIGQITLNKTEIKSIQVSIYENYSDVTIANSTIDIVHVRDNSYVSLINSMIYSLKAFRFFGSLCFEGTTVKRVEVMMYSDFYIYGNVSLEQFDELWLSCNVTRNYGTIVKDRYNEPVSNTSLTLLSEEDVITWNATTDNQGKANFNITFTDSNYTDTLRLEAVKGDFSATMNVSFLSDTPVILTMRYFADLNGDGEVDIRDITIVARAHGSKPEDPNWNAIADLNNDEIIDIRDITIIALEFGKTV